MFLDLSETFLKNNNLHYIGANYCEKRTAIVHFYYICK